MEVWIIDTSRTKFGKNRFAIKQKIILKKKEKENSIAAPFLKVHVPKSNQLTYVCLKII